MTISSVVPVNNYTGNGSATTFDFDFLIENSEELVVTKSDSSGNIITLTENVDYTIHEIGNASGSYITFPISGSSYSVLSSDEVLTLALELEIKQENRFPQARNFEPPIVEKALDYIIRLIQILSRKQERSIKVKESPNLNTEELVNNIEEIKANLTALQNINNDLSNINAVNENKTNIDTVANLYEDISSVAGISTEISTVADNTDSVSICAENIEDINNASINAQIASDKANEASTSAISALSSENFAKDWATKMDSTVDGEEYSAKYYAMQSRDSAGITYKELNASLGYKRENILDDTKLFKEIKELNHSTFDPSKFTAVGTPTITSDGIASGFSSSNYYVISNPIDFTQEFQITVNEKRKNAGTFNGFQISLNGNISKPLLFVQKTNSTYITLGLYINNSLIVQDFTFSHADYTDINYVVSWNRTNYEFKIINALTNETVLTQSTANSNPLQNENASTGVIVYGYNFNSANAIELTDLKQTSVVLNNIPVFSGNKTGTDVIGTDNFTIVGNITINDYIASGFANNSSYIKIPDSVFPSSLTSMTIESDVIIVNSSANQAYFGALQAEYSNAFLDIRLTPTGGQIVYATGAGTQTVTTYTHNAVQDNTRHKLKISIYNSKVNIYFDNVLVKEINNFSYQRPKNFYIGVNRTMSDYWRGSVDLNTFKIYADDKLIYTPYLIIPYTLSYTGLKIVDVSYRDKVQAAYNKYHSAFYYTIDEINKNVTLPMGELYGLISKKSDGEWYRGEIELNTSTAIGSYTVDLSSVLPDDDYDYECVFKYFLRRRDNDSTDTGYKVSCNGMDILQTAIQGGAGTTDYTSLGGQVFAVVDKSREISISIASVALNTHNFSLINYRRLGRSY